MLHLEFRLGSGAEVPGFRASLGLALQDSFGGRGFGAEVGASSSILLRQMWKLRGNPSQRVQHGSESRLSGDGSELLSTSYSCQIRASPRKWHEEVLKQV